jgi:photosystem II stability/assembly factor-like uncharacterized protein
MKITMLAQIQRSVVLFVIAVLIVLFSGTVPAQTWILLTNAPADCLACSADGTKLAAVFTDSGAIYISSDAGRNWTQSTAPTNNWDALACSADGTKLVAVTGYGNASDGIYISSDSGTNWTKANAPEVMWLDVASSADGTNLVALAWGDGIYTSSDAGASWTLTSAPDPNEWIAIVCSADGSKLVAVTGNELYFPGTSVFGILTSSDFGATWTQTSAPGAFWIDVAASADGTKLVATAQGGVYTSTDSGADWTQSTGAPYFGDPSAVASSADGNRLVMSLQEYGSSGLSDVQGIYTSSDAGTNWTQAGAPAKIWGSVASSADGTKRFATSDGGIYAFEMPPVVPVLAITNVTKGMLVSNAMFTVEGWATGNVAVASVYCQLNGTGWGHATSFADSNWSDSVTLNPGTNQFEAYAVDTNGNMSPTTNTTLVYVATATLTVRTNGVAALSPNDNGVALLLGKNYSITAAPVAGAGFAFSNWTGGTSLPLAWLTNGTTVQFTRISNLVLQANFVDTNRPVFAITNESVSGGSFVVSGTNKGVAGIFGQVNGSGWTAGSVNVNNRTWAWVVAQTNLIPGTNYLQFYAQSASGISSPTNSTNYFLAVPAALRVQTNGVANLTPNYNGELLFLGRNYGIAAAAAKGFRFTNWTGGTSLPLGVITNGTNVQFMMVSNLMLAANLVETSRPTLTISAPANGQHLSNAVAMVSGTAGDNWKVTGVWCQVNSNGWALAASTNGWTNWTTALALGAGTNTIYAYAGDPGGNFSPTNSVSVLSSNAFRLWLTNILSGQGNGKGFSLTCSTGLWGHIEYSTNLVDWNILTNFAGTNGSVTFRDPAETNSAQRFYRAVVP